MDADVQADTEYASARAAIATVRRAVDCEMRSAAAAANAECENSLAAALLLLDLEDEQGEK